MTVVPVVVTSALFETSRKCSKGEGLNISCTVHCAWLRAGCGYYSAGTAVVEVVAEGAANSYRAPTP